MSSHTEQAKSRKATPRHGQHYLHY